MLGLSNLQNVTRVSRKSLWRFAWAALLLLHLPATWKILFAAVSTESGSWSSALIITLTNLFFVGEIVFAWSLRIFDDRRKIVVFLMIIALLHVGLMGQGLPDMAGNLNMQIWMALTIGTIALVFRLVISAFWRVTISTLLDDRLSLFRRKYALTVAPIVSHQMLARFVRTLPDRAPPTAR